MRRIKSHTLQKLEYFRKYIEAYLNATKTMYQKYYVDALAGTGKCILCDISSCKSKGGERCMKCGKGKEVAGSASIALTRKNFFNGYILIELNENNLEELKNTIKKEVGAERFKRIDFLRGDSNKFLKKIHDYIPPKAGCLVFLDLEATEIDWNTIESLSKFKKIEILILHPYNMSIVRMTKDYKSKLDKFYGTSNWFKIWKKEVNPYRRKILLIKFYIERIERLGFRYVLSREIKTKVRGGRNLYHLVFATRHPVGKKIMKSVFNIELNGQKKLKFFKD